MLGIAVLAALIVVPTTASPSPVASAAKKCKKKPAKKKKCKRKKPAAVVPPATPTSPSPSPSPPTLTVTGVGATPNPVLAGSPSTGHVTISGAAPAGGQTVTLLSADATRASVPASVDVAPGASGADFTITTTSGADASVMLTASIGASSNNVMLQILTDAGPHLTSISRLSNCITENEMNFPAGQVGIDAPSATPTFISVTSDNPSALQVIDGGATIQAGNTSAPVLVNASAATPAVTLTATLGLTSFNQTFRVRTTAEPSFLTALSLNPTTVAAGGQSIGTVTLDCEALTPGATIALSSSNPNVTVPPSVTVLTGQRVATFPIDAGPTAAGAATITATLGAGTPQQAILTIS
jgi:hypothetical protein